MIPNNRGGFNPTTNFNNAQAAGSQNVQNALGRGFGAGAPSPAMQRPPMEQFPRKINEAGTAGAPAAPSIAGAPSGNKSEIMNAVNTANNGGLTKDDFYLLADIFKALGDRKGR